MHDIKFIRDNPDAFDAAMKRRRLAPIAQELLTLDETRRTQISKRQTMEQERNAIAKSIGQLKGQGKHDEAEAQLSKANALKEQLAAFDAQLEDNPLHAKLSELPNLLDDDVPDGTDEKHNKEIKQVGTPPVFDFPPKDHVDIGEGLEQMDFERAVAMSGSRFVLLSGQLAKLERALAAFMLDIHTGEYGFTEVVPPLLVRENALFGTGQLPKFEEDLFKATTDHYLIPTSEVSLVNIVAEQIIDEDTLPHRYTAYTPCFRSEAGSAGKDTRGMIRLHQFSKVELVSVVAPEDSTAEHERMLEAAEQVLQRLGLAYRIMLLCTGDTGFGAQRTYDIEVWMPSQNCYREISSVSNTGPFQARRMNAKFRRRDQKKPEFLHTLNGSGLAVGRTMVALLENYQQADGSVMLPEALRAYMGGVETIYS